MDDLRLCKRLLNTSAEGRKELLAERFPVKVKRGSIKTTTTLGRCFLAIVSIIYIIFAAWVFIAAPACLVANSFPSGTSLFCAWTEETNYSKNEFAQLVVRERQAVLWLLGGSVAIVTLIMTFRRDEVTRSQYQLALQVHELERDSNTTNRYALALEQLGKENQIERTGALYSLLRIANESPGDREPIVKVLAAYIQGQKVNPNAAMTRRKEVDVVWEGKASIPFKPYSIVATPPARDVLVATEALATITGKSIYEEKISVQEINLEGSQLDTANLLNADLSSANLRNASLRGADLRMLDLSTSDLSGADLTGAHVERVNFPRAMSGAKLDYTQLAGCTFQRSDLTAVSFKKADLRGTDLSNTTGTTRDQLSEAACWNDSTKFPEGMEMGESGPPPKGPRWHGNRNLLGY